MTTSDLIIGGAVVLIVASQLRETFRKHLHADRPSKGRELAQILASAASATPFGAAGAMLTGHSDDSDDASPKTRAGWVDRARWVVSVGVRLAFLIWLYDITDGAALSPFGFAQDIFGGTVWQPVLVVLGLTEVVARVGAIGVRTVTNRKRNADPQLDDHRQPSAVGRERPAVDLTKTTTT